VVAVLGGGVTVVGVGVGVGEGVGVGVGLGEGVAVGVGVGAGVGVGVGVGRGRFLAASLRVVRPAATKRVPSGEDAATAGAAPAGIGTSRAATSMASRAGGVDTAYAVPGPRLSTTAEHMNAARAPRDIFTDVPFQGARRGPRKVIG
jgi:hypothetical protein